MCLNKFYSKHTTFNRKAIYIWIIKVNFDFDSMMNFNYTQNKN